LFFKLGFAQGTDQPGKIAFQTPFCPGAEASRAKLLFKLNFAQARKQGRKNWFSNSNLTNFAQWSLPNWRVIT
jgi:hypothetical protein